MANSLNSVMIALLTDIPAIATVIGDKVYASIAPQGINKPRGSYVVYNITDSYHERSQAALSRYYRIAISVYTQSYKTSSLVHEAIKEKIDRYRGPIAGTNVTAILYEEEADDVVEDRQELHHKPSEYTVIFTDKTIF